jgi:ribosomal protein S18 acetylase RimI-like enzyme
MNITGRALPSEALIDLDRRHFPQPWTLEQWKTFRPDYLRLWTLEDHSRLIGFALFSYLEGDEVAHLLKILIIPEMVGEGRAQKFLGSISEDLKSQSLKTIYLEVEANNLRAQAFYQKMGFVTLRRILNFYSSGSDAITMELTL